MAIDTRDKRLSLLGIGLISLLVLPEPGTLDQPDRQQLLGLYRGIAAAAGTVSIASLESYWTLDEASGTRADSRGSNPLTDNNTVTQAAGKLSTAAQFTAANVESLSHVGNASLTLGDFDFTWAGWVYLDTKGVNRVFIQLKNAGVADYAFLVFYGSVADRYRAVIQSASATTAQSADGYGAPATGVWAFIVAWHDAAANTLNIQVDNGTVSSAAHTTGARTNTFDLTMGADPDAGSLMNGRMDEWFFAKRIYTADERTILFNNPGYATFIAAGFNPAWASRANQILGAA